MSKEPLFTSGTIIAATAIWIGLCFTPVALDRYLSYKEFNALRKDINERDAASDPYKPGNHGHKRDDI